MNVGTVDAVVMFFILQNCQLEHGQSVVTSASIVLPPLTPISTFKSLPTQSTVLPTFQGIPRPGDSPQQDTGISGGGVSNISRLLSLPKAKDAPQPSRLGKNPPQTATETKSLVGSVTSWLPHSSTIQVDNMQRNKENEPSEAPRPQYVEYLAGRKFLIIPKHNVVSISPTVTNKISKPVIVEEEVEKSPKDIENENVEVPVAENTEVVTEPSPVTSEEVKPE